MPWTGYVILEHCADGVVGMRLMPQPSDATRKRVERWWDRKTSDEILAILGDSRYATIPIEKLEEI